jgi:3-methyladenine DNA glycosylase AlkD
MSMGNAKLSMESLVMKKKEERSFDVETVLDMLRAKADPQALRSLERFAVTTREAIGVKTGDIRAVGKTTGRNHRLADQLWRTGIYEAQLLAAFVAVPAELTEKQIEKWCHGFDNWAVCDTHCTQLFVKTPFAWGKVPEWSTSDREFVKRAAFSLLAGLAVHDKKAHDELFIDALPWIEQAADDDRNFVKKAVNWSLRQIGKRNESLCRPALELAEQLAQSSNPASRWIGRDAVRELSQPRRKRRQSPSA